MPGHRETIQLLMQEIGPQTPAIDAVVQHDDGNWALQFEGGAIVLMEYGHEPERLVMSTELGEPAPERRLETCQLLLSYNLLWQETGGLKTALGGPEGGAMLLFEWFSAAPQLQELQQRLEHFCHIAAAWRNYIAHGADLDPALSAPVSGLSNFA